MHFSMPQHCTLNLSTDDGARVLVAHDVTRVQRREVLGTRWSVRVHCIREGVEHELKPGTNECDALRLVFDEGGELEITCTKVTCVDV